MLKRVKKFFELEASTGILLMISTVLSLSIANSENHQIFKDFFNINLPLIIESLDFNKDLTLREWINDALMAIFFLFVGLELKKEVLEGELSSKKRAALPAIAAIGGVIFPALIFYFFNRGIEKNMPGIAIPTATDIAFAYGVICMFGKRIPKSLKIFLISLAIFDDLFAIIIIAIFYSKNLSLYYLALSLIVISLLIVLQIRKIYHPIIHIICGTLLWLIILKSGVHTTVAGVILAILTPMHDGKKSPVEYMAHKLAPIVNFMILPTFAFANAGVRLEGFSMENLFDPMVVGIVVGLFFGKQIGVMLLSFIAIKFKLCDKPVGVSWLEFYGVTILTGIGFTMSLFISSLAFVDNEFLFEESKVGILSGSLFSTVFGIIIISISLFLSLRRAAQLQTQTSEDH